MHTRNYQLHRLLVILGPSYNLHVHAYKDMWTCKSVVCERWIGIRIVQNEDALMHVSCVLARICMRNLVQIFNIFVYTCHYERQKIVLKSKSRDPAQPNHSHMHAHYQPFPHARTLSVGEEPFENPTLYGWLVARGLRARAVMLVVMVVVRR